LKNRTVSSLQNALQAFAQDRTARTLNHDNEYLHYEDDWWIITNNDNNDKKVPPFASSRGYRGSNDDADGYWGVVTAGQ
jgi:violaxanthin de-epoxidase